MENLSDKEILNFALQNGIIDINTIQMQIEMNERQKFLDMHESRVWQSTDKKWYTYLPDDKNANGRRLIKRNTKDELDNCIVECYRKKEKPITVKVVFDEWIEKKVKFKEISKQTVDRYTCDFYRYFNKNTQRKNIKHIDEEFLEDFIVNSIVKNNLKSKGWSNLRTILRGMFVFAKKKGYTSICINSFLSELELSKKMFNHDKKPVENVIFTNEEVHTLVQNISDSKRLNDLAILFAVYTGMRVGEIVALKWEDISDDFIHVNRTQVHYKDENGKTVREIRDFPKTEAGIRNIVIVPQLRTVIKKLRMINPFSEYVFERKGRCVPEHSVCTRLYNLCDRFEFPRKGMHSLRRYYATKLINAGVEEIIILSQMGHCDINTTKEHYYKNNNQNVYVCERIRSVMEV